MNCPENLANANVKTLANLKKQVFRLKEFHSVNSRSFSGKLGSWIKKLWFYYIITVYESFKPQYSVFS